MMKLALLAVCAVLPGAIADAGDCTADDYFALMVAGEDATLPATCKFAPPPPQTQFG